MNADRKPPRVVGRREALALLFGIPAIVVTYFKWTSSVIERPKGTVIVAHGLNNKPEVMDALGMSLNLAGFNTCRVSLAIKEKENKLESELGEFWHQNLADVVKECEDKTPDVPILGLGYSLGGLVMTSYQNENPSTFQKLFLLAPAIALHRKTMFLKPLAWLAGGTNLSIPSLAPKAFRLRDSTPLAEYNAMFQMTKSVKQLKKPEKFRSSSSRSSPERKR